MLQSAIGDMNLERFLPMLSKLDQDEAISTIPPLDRHHQMFYWIFRNMDFTQWDSAKCSQVLWLCGPPECNLHQVASHILSQEKNKALERCNLILYFFFSAAIKERSNVNAFLHTLLKQIVCYPPLDKGILIIRSFLYRLLKETFKDEATPTWKQRGFNKEESPDENVQKILHAPANEFLTALGTVLRDEEQRGLLVVLDGLDKVEDQRGEFIVAVRAFVERLQKRTSMVKILLTSRPLTEIKDIFNGLPCIEYDRERKGPSVLYVLTFN